MPNYIYGIGIVLTMCKQLGYVNALCTDLDFPVVIVIKLTYSLGYNNNNNNDRLFNLFAA